VHCRNRQQEDKAMAWIYSQSTGILTHNGNHIATGYSGNGEGKNNPAMQNVPNTGPCPQGNYQIGPPKDDNNVGPFALPLTPLPGTNTFGRFAFLIHGDSIVHPGTASEGCIILLRDARNQIAGSGDQALTVTA
jgi:Protein of unknown function (DUF2778)